MLKNFLSFCSIPELHDKNPLSQSPLGELSNKTRTYAKDPNIYTDPGIALINFYTLDENEKDFVIPGQFVDRQLEVCQWLLANAKSGNIGDDEFECLQQLKTQFTKDITFTEIGQMVTNSAIFLPSFVEMEFPDGEENTIKAKIWFANAHFESEYPYKEIEIVLPLPNDEIDFLYENIYIDVEERLKKETPDVIQHRVDEITENSKYPYTHRMSLMYLWHDTVNNVTIPTYFTVLFWGNPADSDELVLDKIAEVILANSKYDEEGWTPKYPDIFNPLEFICVAHFEKIGIENLKQETSTYSPIVNYDDALELPTRYAPNLSPEGLIKSLQVVPFMYKSAQVSFVGKPDNYDGINKISMVFPDYQLFEVDGPASGLMEVQTLAWVRDMQTLISAAEVMTPTNLAVPGVRRLNRYGMFYVAKRINKINYVVVSRYQMVKDGILSE